MVFDRTIDHKVVRGPCKQVSGTPATSCTMSINPTLANEVETLLMNFTAVHLILKKDPWKPSQDSLSICKEFHSWSSDAKISNSRGNTDQLCDTWALLSPCMYIKLQFRAILVLKSWLLYWYVGPHHSRHLRKDIERWSHWESCAGSNIHGIGERGGSRCCWDPRFNLLKRCCWSS